jgi:ferredoxin
MSTEIYYFSGTGNSLHVAEELRERIPDARLIPMVGLLQQDAVETGAETVGFVFPVHLMAIPAVVQKFLEKLDVRSARYIFAVLTQGGTPVLADVYLDDILAAKGSTLDAFFTIRMPWNSPVGLMPVYIPGMITYPPRQERVAELESKMQVALDTIQRVLENKEVVRGKDRGLSPKKAIAALMSGGEKTKRKKVVPYYADSQCTGCGTCARVCTSGKIEMVDERPVWQPDAGCYHCYACFNFCPAQSVLVRKTYDRKLGRYHHPAVAADDIADQKRQAHVA